jgi:hypothetical protein
MSDAGPPVHPYWILERYLGETVEARPMVSWTGDAATVVLCTRDRVFGLAGSLLYNLIDVPRN